MDIFKSRVLAKQNSYFPQTEFGLRFDDYDFLLAQKILKADSLVGAIRLVE